MANPKVYTLTTYNSNTTSLATTHTGVAAGATLTSNGIPCKGARMVVIRVVGTDNNTPVGVAVYVGNNASRTAAFFVSSPLGYTTAGNVTGASLSTYGANGASVAFFPTNASQKNIHHDFVQVIFTANATNAHTSVTISAEVHYDFDGDQQMNGNGQGGIVPLTT